MFQRAGAQRIIPRRTPWQHWAVTTLDTNDCCLKWMAWAPSPHCSHGVFFSFFLIAPQWILKKMLKFWCKFCKNMSEKKYALNPSGGNINFPRDGGLPSSALRREHDGALEVGELALRLRVHARLCFAKPSSGLFLWTNYDSRGRGSFLLASYLVPNSSKILQISD